MTFSVPHAGSDDQSLVAGTMSSGLSPRGAPGEAPAGPPTRPFDLTAAREVRVCRRAQPAADSVVLAKLGALLYLRVAFIPTGSGAEFASLTPSNSLAPASCEHSRRHSRTRRPSSAAPRRCGATAPRPRRGGCLTTFPRGWPTSSSRCAAWISVGPRLFDPAAAFLVPGCWRRAQPLPPLPWCLRRRWLNRAKTEQPARRSIA